MGFSKKRVNFLYFEHPKTPDRSPGTNLDFLEMVKKGVSEECKNKGLEKYDPGDKDSSGPGGASISC